MSEMIERVADAMGAAIVKQEGVGNLVGGYDGGNGDIAVEAVIDLRAVARAAIAAMPGWQPIESAPQDWTQFLAWCPSTGLVLMRIRGIESETWSLTGRVKHPEPTHWIALPEPPK